MKLQGKPAVNLMLYFAVIGVGLVLPWLTRNPGDMEMNGKAGFLLGSVDYDPVVTFRTGQEIRLFGGGVFEWRMDRPRMEELRGRFEKAIFA